MFRNGAKLFPRKGVFKVSWNNCFEMTKKGPITAPSGMDLLQGRKHGQRYTQWVFKDSLDHANKMGVTEICVSNII